MPIMTRYHYISYLSLCNELPQIKRLNATQIYYLTVYVDQESRHSLAGSPALDLPRL